MWSSIETALPYATNQNNLLLKISDLAGAPPPDSPRRTRARRNLDARFNRAVIRVICGKNQPRITRIMVDLLLCLRDLMMFLKVQKALLGLIFLAAFSPTTAYADDEIRIDLPAGGQLKVRNDFGNVDGRSLEQQLRRCLCEHWRRWLSQIQPFSDNHRQSRLVANDLGRATANRSGRSDSSQDQRFPKRRGSMRRRLTGQSRSSACRATRI